MSGYQQKAPFEASVLVAFRKRINLEILIEENEYILDTHHKDGKNKNDHEPP